MNDPVIDWRKDSRSFDTVAELYDTYRPGYPGFLIEYILSTTTIPKSGTILEIGSGTGKATTEFAQRGYSILCIEPGKHLVRIARQKLKAFPKVKFQVTTFEDWQNNEGLFDVVISAQAFHWIEPEIRYQKTADVLKPNGHLALFWNRPPPLEASIAQKLNRVYQEYAPELVQGKPRTYEEGVQFWIRELEKSKYFDLVEVKRHPWVESYTTQQYLGLLNTHSDHLRLSEEKRRQLFAGIEEVLEKEGGRLDKPYEAVAYIARKRGPTASME